MRMCILGGGGYLGQLLAHALQRDDHFVVLFDLHFRAKFPHIKIDEKLTKRMEGSVENPSQLEDALNGCDTCFHLAGFGMSGGASLDRQKCFDVNYSGTKSVIEVCKRLGVTRLLFTSSVAVIFDGHNELHMADEENTPYVQNFGNPYAESKCAAEKLVLAANQPPFLSTCALRLRGIYGPGELRTVQRFVNYLYGRALCVFSKSAVPLTQFSSAENTVNALMLAEQSLRKGEQSLAAGNTYHIVDGGNPVHSWGFWNPLAKALGCSTSGQCLPIPYSLMYAFAFLCEMLYHWFGLEPYVTRYEIALVGITNTYSISRAQRDIGYKPIRSHDLSSTIDFYLKRQQQQQNCSNNQNNNQNQKMKHRRQHVFHANTFVHPRTEVAVAFFEPKWLWLAWLFGSLCSIKGLQSIFKYALLFLLLLVARWTFFWAKI